MNKINILVFLVLFINSTISACCQTEDDRNNAALATAIKSHLEETSKITTEELANAIQDMPSFRQIFYINTTISLATIAHILASKIIYKINEAGGLSTRLLQDPLAYDELIKIIRFVRDTNNIPKESKCCVIL